MPIGGENKRNVQFCSSLSICSFISLLEPIFYKYRDMYSHYICKFYFILSRIVEKEIKIILPNESYLCAVVVIVVVVVVCALFFKKNAQTEHKNELQSIQLT